MRFGVYLKGGPLDGTFQELEHFTLWIDAPVHVPLHRQQALSETGDPPSGPYKVASYALRDRERGIYEYTGPSKFAVFYDRLQRLSPQFGTTGEAHQWLYDHRHEDPWMYGKSEVRWMWPEEGE